MRRAENVTTECSAVLFILFAIHNWEQESIKLFRETRVAFVFKRNNRR